MCCHRTTVDPPPPLRGEVHLGNPTRETSLQLRNGHKPVATRLGRRGEDWQVGGQFPPWRKVRLHKRTRH